MGMPTQTPSSQTRIEGGGAREKGVKASRERKIIRLKGDFLARMRSNTKKKGPDHVKKLCHAQRVKRKGGENNRGGNGA